MTQLTAPMPKKVATIARAIAQVSHQLSTWLGSEQQPDSRPYTQPQKEARQLRISHKPLPYRCVWGSVARLMLAHRSGDPEIRISIRVKENSPSGRSALDELLRAPFAFAKETEIGTDPPYNYGQDLCGHNPVGFYAADVAHWINLDTAS